MHARTGRGVRGEGGGARGAARSQLLQGEGERVLGNGPIELVLAQAPARAQTPAAHPRQQVAERVP